MKKSGELLLALTPTKSHIDPTLISGFLSAISVFSKEMLGYDVDVIAIKTHKLVVDNIENDLMLAVLIDDKESIIDVQNKIKEIKEYLKIALPKSVQEALNELSEKLPEVKEKIRNILESGSSFIPSFVSGQLKQVLEQIARYDEVTGVLVMDEGCKELASLNLDEDKKFVIRKQLENLYLLSSIYTPKKVIFFTDYDVVVSIKEDNFIVSATTPNQAYIGLTLATLEKNLPKIREALNE